MPDPIDARFSIGLWVAFHDAHVTLVEASPDSVTFHFRSGWPTLEGSPETISLVVREPEAVVVRTDGAPSEVDARQTPLQRFAEHLSVEEFDVSDCRSAEPYGAALSFYGSFTRPEYTHIEIDILTDQFDVLLDGEPATLKDLQNWGEAAWEAWPPKKA